MCILLSTSGQLDLFGVAVGVIHTSMVDWRGVHLPQVSICEIYSAICEGGYLFVCSGIPYIYGQLEGGTSAIVYVHSAICETYLV